jgi:homoserine O-succinyltransferase/O-acetyltransferase
MVVLLQGNASAYPLAPGGDPSGLENLVIDNDDDCIKLAFVNNMPEPAFATAERQYLKLIKEAATDELSILIKMYSLAGRQQRSDWRHPRRSRYFDISELAESRHDAIIMTGTEPRTCDITKETFWDALTEVVDWSKENVVSAIWSCLAAHAAVRHLDGIRRHPLRAKCFGLFPCDAAMVHPLLDGISFPFLVQHSRWNSLDAAELRAAGYVVLTQSAAAGVDMFLKHEKCLFLFFQGHPEYERDTLMREYRRDVGRYLRNEQDNYPTLPEGCLGEEATSALLEFRSRAVARRPALSLLQLPLPETVMPNDRCGSAALHIYRNWLSMISSLKARRSPAVLRRSARWASSKE